MWNVNIYPNDKKGRLWKLHRLRCQHCGSYEKWYPTWILRLHFLFNKKLYTKCPVCHKVCCYELQTNIIHNTTDKTEKEINKKVWEERLLK